MFLITKIKTNLKILS